MGALLRFAGGLAGVPVGLAGLLFHRMRTGTEAVIDVDVGQIPDLRDRQRWLHRLRRLGTDSLVSGVLLRLHQPPGGWAACQDLRATILELRRSGRSVYALVEAPGNALAWIASACDRVFMVPTGELGLVGVGVEMTFFGAALNRLGIRPDFEAAGAYKSFGEPWTRTFPSPANHEAVRDLVDDLHAQLVAGIAEGRGRSVDDVTRVLERCPLSGPEAVVEGLVDQLAYPDQVEEWLKEKHGSRSRFVSFERWGTRDAGLEWVASWGGADTVVGVLHLQGPISVDDQARGPSIRARKVVPMLKQLREDDRVGAVVLHIDSPGGSALASDLIWREVDQLRRAKPVVASFEDVAASGGYYLAAPAAEILVRAGTLTGSIGVFGGKLVMAEGLRKLGVHSQEVLGAPNANMFSAARHFTDEQRDRFRSSLQRFYDGFVQRVADGRSRPEEEIEPHCRGRVWTGRAAIEHDLADQTGDLDAAVDRARILAGLHEGQFVRRELSAFHTPLWSRLAQVFLRQYAPAALAPAAALLGAALPAGAAAMVEVVLAHPDQPLAMLPFDLRPRS